MAHSLQKIASRFVGSSYEHATPLERIIAKILFQEGLLWLTLDGVYINQLRADQLAKGLNISAARFMAEYVKSNLDDYS